MDDAILEKLVEEVTQQLKFESDNLEGAVDIAVDNPADVPFLDIKFNRKAIARYGLSIRTVSEAIETAWREESFSAYNIPLDARLTYTDPRDPTVQIEFFDDYPEAEYQFTQEEVNGIFETFRKLPLSHIRLVKFVAIARLSQLGTIFALKGFKWI